MQDNVALLKDQPVCVSELSQLFGLTTRAIRFYEERGLIRSVRDRANKRWFDVKARRQLQFIAQMRRAGLTIAEIGRIIKTVDQGGETKDYTALALERLSARLVTLDQERADVVAALAAITEGRPLRGELAPNPFLSAKRRAS